MVEGGTLPHPKAPEAPIPNPAKKDPDLEKLVGTCGLRDPVIGARLVSNIISQGFLIKVLYSTLPQT